MVKATRSPGKVPIDGNLDGGRVSSDKVGSAARVAARCADRHAMGAAWEFNGGEVMRLWIV